MAYLWLNLFALALATKLSLFQMSKNLSDHELSIYDGKKNKPMSHRPYPARGIPTLKSIIDGEKSRESENNIRNMLDSVTIEDSTPSQEVVSANTLNLSKMMKHNLDYKYSNLFSKLDETKLSEKEKTEYHRHSHSTPPVLETPKNTEKDMNIKQKCLEKEEIYLQTENANNSNGREKRKSITSIQTTQTGKFGFGKSLRKKLSFFKSKTVYTYCKYRKTKTILVMRKKIKITQSFQKALEILPLMKTNKKKITTPTLN